MGHGSGSVQQCNLRGRVLGGSPVERHAKGSMTVQGQATLEMSLHI